MRCQLGPRYKGTYDNPHCQRHDVIRKDCIGNNHSENWPVASMIVETGICTSLRRERQVEFKSPRKLGKMTIYMLKVG